MNVFLRHFEQLYSFVVLSGGVLDTTLCDKVCQGLATGRCFSPGTPVSSTNKIDRHDITEIVLIVTLNTITLTLTVVSKWSCDADESTYTCVCDFYKRLIFVFYAI